MDKNLYSAPDPGRSNAELSQLLHTVFNIILNRVKVLEAMRNKDNKIIDFKYMLVNREHTGTNEPEGELLLTVDPGAEKTGLFKKLVAVVEQDEQLDDILHDHYDGNDQWFHVKAQKYNNGVVFSREEITEKKQADGKIRELNRVLSDRNRKLEMLSSELKTFNTIAANDYAESLRLLYTSLEFIISQDAKNLSNTGKAHIRRAQSAIQKMKLLTDDIISYSNIQSHDDAVPVKLDEILSVAIRNLQEKIQQADAALQYERLPEIIGHPPLLILLFTHLVENALKFRKDDTHHQVKITSSHMNAASHTYPNAQKDMDYHQITIEDNGIGFEKVDQEKIFDMFYRPLNKAKYGGSGIGLAICKKIMEIHGGFITAECVPECTRFHCFFPVT